MKQTRRHSLYESLTNVILGGIISVLLTQYVVAPIFHARGRFTVSLGITAMFAIASFARAYWVRRVFEAIRESFS